MSLTGDTKLGGRLFNVVNYDVITALNEHYIMKWIRRTGLDKVLPLPDGETDEQYLMRLQGALIDTLELPQLLAGYLLPAGKSETDFTLQMAEQTTAFISGVTDPEDRAEIQRLGLQVVLDFFRSGIASIKHSLSVLERTIPTTNESRGPRAAH